MVLLLVVLVLVAFGFIYYFYKTCLDHGLTASGTIEVTDVTVSSKVVATLEVKVDEGSQVKQGDTLAVLDPSELQQSLLGAQARYQIAKDDFARNKQLFADRMISPAIRRRCFGYGRG